MEKGKTEMFDKNESPNVVKFIEQFRQLEEEEQNKILEKLNKHKKSVIEIVEEQGQRFGEEKKLAQAEKEILKTK